MTQINRVPRGLQDLLNTQSFGKNPSELAQVVMPTLEMGRFFQAEKLEIVRAQADNLTVGDEVNITIPVGENWYVEQVTRGLNDFVPSFDYMLNGFIDLNQRTTGGPDAFPLRTMERDGSARIAQDIWYETDPVGMWFPSGTVFSVGLSLSGSTPAGMDMVIALLALKLQV